MTSIRTVACLTLLILAAATGAHAQEPSGVVGYIAFTDPRTGERWIPINDAGNLMGYPGLITVVFRSKTDAREHRVSIENWGGTMRLRDAIKYEITFTHSDFATDTPPTLLESREAGSRPRQVQFHFDRWRFDRVEISYWRLFSGGRETGVPLTRRATPFPDLR